MEDERITELVKTIYAGTEQGKIKWEQSADDDTFLVPFSGYSLRMTREIFYSVPEEDSEQIDYRLEIFDDTSTLLEVIRSSDIKTWRRRKSSYIILSELWSMARRHALGVNEAIDTILDALSKLSIELEDPAIEEEDDSTDDADGDNIPF
jgi:hypothetical protein